ncbi:isoaspartyl peptidase/L-asparaginase family protein [Fodinibius sp. SL11]|uniref:isoaspartyl peptidase/L-asparaginase family protein n=1 Tax=Fodinibius sp. SL11 TaxID=3425690 RepID=UPI003F8832B5
MGLGKKLIGLLAVLLVVGCTQSEGQQETQQKEWALALHGGAGAISEDRPDSVKQAYFDDLDEALTIGEDILADGGSAEDAVESVINYLEDNPRFNAGKGAVFTHDGEHELDAAFMVGNTREAGTVTGVKTVKNPITLARKVMETSEHVMFATEGAERYADKVGVERVDQEYFYTESRYQALQRVLEREKEEDSQQSSLILKEDKMTLYADNEKFGTVGCVAVDKDGQIVAGTSTGGMTNKKFGRVGDVPIIGSGTYASDVVAVSMTGWGEKIMRAVSGHTVSAYMKYNDASLQEAGDYLLNDVLEPGEAGMIAVDKYGNIYTDMNTNGMFRGSSDSEGNREVAIWD